MVKPAAESFAAKSPAARSLSGGGRGGAGASQRRPAFLYATLRDLLRRKIASHELPAGLVMKEAQLAGQLGVSRAPVRRALALLADEGLIRQAGGQGYVVGTAAPLRMPLRQLHRILTEQPEEIDRSATWERIYEDVREEITAAMPFGSWRIQEEALGRHYHVSRTVAREVLWRLLDRRLVIKDSKSHWIVGQMTARDLRETLEMRLLLEPAALAQVQPGLDPDWLDQAGARLARVMDAFPAVDPVALDDLDQLMFQQIFGGLRNSRLLASIRRNQISLVVPHLFRQHFPLVDDLAALQDYALILRHLRHDEPGTAQALLAAHLTRIGPLTLARLRVLSQLPPPLLAPWLMPET
ncbi:GntR family transcriptional regulator [Xinfangfangia sp. D13-10-4-6]|uniref:GntR family transcriptional regulator n=1 Tax=Pseudogemmobacter hezensis TaxID=2737662 RepID=UPI001557AF04|nr:GntR family transcriptional regulator [Pseudogemmobacter hezensis]NPD14017.1 GntR family transcriptional regulator [Pseudogemmobacter hezensis]